MDIVYADKDLALINTHQASGLKMSVQLIKAARSKLNFIKGAVDERDLRNWKGLHFEKLKGDRKGQCSIRLNNQWRLIFTIENDTVPARLTVLEICDYHD